MQEETPGIGVHRVKTARAQSEKVAMAKEGGLGRNSSADALILISRLREK